MQKDLLTELHLPKLDLKGIQDIVRQNSVRLACLIKENNEFLSKSEAASPGIEVVGGLTGVNSPSPPPSENVETSKQNFIIKESPLNKNFLSNGSKQFPHSAETNLALKSDTVDSNEVNSTEIRPLLETKNQSHFEIPPCESNLRVHNCSVTESYVCTRTGTSGDNSCDEEAEVEIILNNSFKKCSGSDPLFLSPHRSLFDEETGFSSSTKDSVLSLTENVVSEQIKANEKESEFDDCLTSDSTGNANEALSKSNNSHEETHDVALITPKKTNDITKIKGWRRKQFFVEKPTTVEFYSISERSPTLKKKIHLRDCSNYCDLEEEPDKKENAFVCDSLDEFLDQEADLKIKYEIPHLCAEYGIKLTRDEIVSRPSLSEKDIKEVEMRYWRPISLPSDGTNLEEIEENFKTVKRPIEEDVKPCKMLKLEGNKKQSLKIMHKQPKKPNPESETNSIVSESVAEDLGKDEFNQSENNFSTIKLMSKLIGLVVYPGPYTPLHPFVQFHLHKIRSYRTQVDENWANFAASAVLKKTKKCKRRILPVHCCVKVEKESTTTTDVQDEKVDGEKTNEEQTKLKECSVVIEKLDFEGFNPWCMEHNCYSCVQCGLAKQNNKECQLRVLSAKRPEKKMKTRVEKKDTIIGSPQASFDKKVANMLAKKVQLLKANGDTLKNIDFLKNLIPNTIEFIKLKFVKESFLAGHINVWYLKPLPTGRSRAFLTFSQTSPLPNAINLKFTKFPLNNLPKVITEIVSGENTFDSNEYAILHCDGEIWEIHGCLNITFGKTEKNVEQIFASVELPELKKLQEIAFDVLNVKAAKWWVLDLSQRFRLIELSSGYLSTVVTRKKILESIMLNLFGFKPLMTRKDFGNRVIGAYIIQRLLPFILIGPYYLLEPRDMVLKDVSSTIPFEYHGEENVTTNYPLKFFINSVIRNLENNDKILEGLWLYDKMCLDNTSYLEVVTSNSGGLLPNKNSVIDIEHGYSLNSLTNSSPCGVTSGIIKRFDGKEELKTVTVYLYFDIFELGFVEGELQLDNSVIINHPLDHRTKMKSHKIGDWFISIIKRRIEFIPKDLVVRWFITKHKDDLRDRRAFNKFFLSGAHVLTKNGVFFLLELSESKIEKLGLDKKEIAKAIGECEVIKEVTELKNLANLMANPLKKTLSMDEVLTNAIKEIKDLEEIQKSLKRKKMMIQKQASHLIISYLGLINSLRIGFQEKMNMIDENIGKFFRKENGDLTENFIKLLKKCRAGWKYLKYVKSQRISCNEISKEDIKAMQIPSTDEFNSKNLQLSVSSLQKNSSSGISVLKKPFERLLKVSPDVNGETNSLDAELETAKSNFSFNECGSFEINFPKVLENSVKELHVKNTESEKVKNTELASQNLQDNFPSKNEEFLNLTSPKLPENVKVCWENWSINKLEVV